MIQVLVRHKVADYQAWRAVFDAALDFRHKGGEQSARIFRDVEEEGMLTLLFDWDTMENARRFMHSPELGTKMKQAGVQGTPEIHFLAEMYLIRRSAAD